MNRNMGHGFVWPDGLPGCAMCGRPAQDGIHVTPAATVPATLASELPKNEGDLPLRAHAYVMSGGLTSRVRCGACGQGMGDSRHPAGMPSGNPEMWMVGGPGYVGGRVGARQTAFVAEIGGRHVFATRGHVGADSLPDRVAEVYREKSATKSPILWITGRYVEADNPNRNAAFWSTDDLQFGEPSVAHGPINWLHEERHIIGAIAASQLVEGDREAAAETGVGKHIVALGAVWPWIWPNEARVIADASQAGGLWFSMECISRSVACLADDCGHEMDYATYMRQKAQRCEHMTAGAPRRFVEPVFEGAGIIVPPVRPGWARADARVILPQAAALAERQAAAFEGMDTSDAEMLVAQLIASAEEPTPV